MVVKSSIRDWLKVVVLLLDEAAVLVLVLLVLWSFKIKIPVTAVVVGGLLLGVLVFMVHRAVIPSLYQKKVTGAEGMIGLEGEVVQPLTPVGLVKIKDEYWKARSVGGNVEAGESVEIMAINGLTLQVRQDVIPK